jgi:hypothetical protein
MRSDCRASRPSFRLLRWKGVKEVGAGDRSRTYTGVSPEDFESSASAIPPLRPVSILGQDSLVGNFINASASLVILGPN